MQNADLIKQQKVEGIKHYYLKDMEILKVIATVNSYIIETHKKKFHKLLDSDNVNILK